MDSESLRREMGITHQDFYRILPLAMDGYKYTIKNNKVRVKLADGDITVSLGQESFRNIASLSLPLTIVHFEIKNVAEKSKKAFFLQFDRAYQRGGG